MRELLARLGPTPLLALAAVLPCAQLLSAGFLDYDDPLFLLQQPFWSDPSLANLVDVWSRPIYGSFHPLHQTSYYVDRLLFGQTAWGVRSTNLVLYALILVGFAAVGRRLALPPAGVLLGGLLYAWHPSHVENVAWVSQRKDLLSAALLLAAFAVYLGPRPHPLRGPDPPLPSWPRVAGCCALFVLGLLGKSVTVVLVPWLILLALGRGSLRREGTRLACLAGAGCAATVAHYLAQDAVGAAIQRPPPVEHLGRLARALGHYACSVVAPHAPAPRLPLDQGWTGPQLAGIGLCLVWAACSWRWAALRTWGLMAWAGIGPMWGLVPLPTFVQDRYLLWATLPLAWAAGSGLAHLGRGRARRRVVVGSSLAVALGLFAVSLPYAGTWSSGRELWTANARAYPRLIEPREALVQVYAASPDPSERELALRMARELLQHAPTRLVPNLTLAEAAQQRQDYDAARTYLQAAARATDNTAYRAPLLLAAVELELDELDAARAALEQAATLAPADSPELLGGWAAWHLARGEAERARELAAEASTRLPEWGRAWELQLRAARRQGDAAGAAALLTRVPGEQRAILRGFLALDAGDLEGAGALLAELGQQRTLEVELLRACYDAQRGEVADARARRTNLLAHCTPGARRRILSEPAWPLD